VNQSRTRLQLLVAAVGVAAAVASAIAAVTGNLGPGPAAVVGFGGLLAAWLLRRKRSPTPRRPSPPAIPSPGPSAARSPQMTSPPPPPPTSPRPRTEARSVTDVVHTDAKLVSAGSVTVVDFDENSAVSPTNVARYRTVRHGQLDFEFAVVRLRSGNYRVYILQQPAYGSRDVGAHPTHRLTDSRGRRYVCWDSVIPTARAAMAIGGEWAELTARYILNGTPITSPDPSASQHEALVRAQYAARG
jgi:hypothetical protein